MTQILFIVSLLVLLSMFGIKMLEEKRGREFAFSLWLASFDDYVAPRLATLFVFLRGNGEGSLKGILFSLPGKLSSILWKTLTLIQGKLKTLNHSSRGQYSLK
ncbi:MAG: hypothetical protein AAB706_04145, partial [Patescibacteria group bacterium]